MLRSCLTRERAGFSYRGPMCPPLIFGAKRRCILVTSLGSTAAPGPSRMASSCGHERQLRRSRLAVWRGLYQIYLLQIKLVSLRPQPEGMIRTVCSLRIRCDKLTILGTLDYPKESGEATRPGRCSSLGGVAVFRKIIPRICRIPFARAQCAFWVCLPIILAI